MAELLVAVIPFGMEDLLFILHGAQLLASNFLLLLLNVVHCPALQTQNITSGD